MALLGGLLAKKAVFGFVSTFLYGGGGGGVAYGVVGLGTEIDTLSETEVEVDDTVVPQRKPLRAKRNVEKSDRIVMGNKRVDQAIDPTTNLPKGLVSSQMYQMQDSTDFENNDQKYYCSKIILDDKVKGTEKNERQQDIKGNAKWNYGRVGYYYACANVLGHKDYYDNGKGRGSGKFQYNIVNIDYTVVLVNTVNADNGKLMIDGAAYVLTRVFDKQDNSKFTGDVTGGKPQPRQELTKENKDRLLVAPGKSLKHKQDDGGFGFDNEKVCKDDECFGNSLRTEYSNRIGKLEYQKKDKEAGDQLGEPYDGGSNFEQLMGKDGMFEGLRKEFQTNMKGYYRLDVNNHGINNAQQ